MGAGQAQLSPRAATTDERIRADRHGASPSLYLALGDPKSLTASLGGAALLQAAGAADLARRRRHGDSGAALVALGPPGLLPRGGRRKAGRGARQGVAPAGGSRSHEVAPSCRELRLMLACADASQCCPWRRRAAFSGRAAERDPRPDQALEGGAPVRLVQGAALHGPARTSRSNDSDDAPLAPRPAGCWVRERLQAGGGA